MDDEIPPRQTQRDRDAIVDEILHFATPAQLRRILRRAGSPEELEAVLVEIADLKAGQRWWIKRRQDIIYLVTMSASIIGALVVIRLFLVDVVQWLVQP